MNVITDIQLMQCTRAGDDAAFCALVERYQDRLMTFFCRRLRRPNDLADELAQRTFIRLFDITLRPALPESDDGSIEYLILAIAGAFHVDHRRHEDAQATLRADIAVLGVRDSPSSDARYLEWETRRVVREAIAMLPEDDQFVIELRYLQELSSAEVARRTRTPVSTIKRRIERATGLLRIWLEPYWKGVRRHGRWI